MTWPINPHATTWRNAAWLQGAWRADAMRFWHRRLADLGSRPILGAGWLTQGFRSSEEYEAWQRWERTKG